MAALALKALDYGVDKIPDAAWHKIPVFRPKDQDSNNQDSRSRRGSNISDDSNSDIQSQSHHSDEQGLSHTVDKIPDRHWDKLPGLKPKEKERRRDKRSSKGHHGLSDSESDQSYSRGDRKKDSRTQDRSRDTRSSFDGTQNRTSWAQQGRAETTRAMGDSYYPPPPPAGDYPRRYNPQDYQPRNESYQPRNEEYHSYANTNYGPEQYAPSRAYRDGPYTPVTPQIDNRRYSTYENSTPATYYPPQQQQQQQQYEDRDRDRERERDQDRDRDRRGRDKEKKKHRKRQDSQSRSRSKSGVRGMIDRRFEKSERGLTSSAIGAIAGGLIANEIGKGPLATVAGVLLGGLGANAWEAREVRHRDDAKPSKADGKRSKSKPRNSRSQDGGDQYTSRSSYSKDKGGSRPAYDSESSYDSESDHKSRRSRSKSGKSKRDRGGRDRGD